ncbi:hypothetical protein ACWDBD_37095 [Streptomyces sp. NPDC001118]
MSAEHDQLSGPPEQWTPDLLETETDRKMHLAQRRLQLLPIVDDLRRIAREMQEELDERDAIEGDFPGQSWLRARNVARPLFKAADDCERVLTDLIAFNARYKRSYEDLPQKREDKRQRKELAKAPQPQEITKGGEETEKAQFTDVFDGLRKGA